MRKRSLLAVVPLIGVLLFLAAGPAGAVGGVTVSNGAPVPGSAISVTSTGWFPGRTVTLGLTGVNEELGRATADATGAVHTRITVPADVPANPGVLSVTGTASTGVPQQIVAALAVHRLAPVHTPTRPWLAVLVLAWIAGVLLLASVRIVTPAHRLAA